MQIPPNLSGLTVGEAQHLQILALTISDCASSKSTLPFKIFTFSCLIAWNLNCIESDFFHLYLRILTHNFQLKKQILQISAN